MTFTVIPGFLAGVGTTALICLSSTNVTSGDACCPNITVGLSLKKSPLMTTLCGCSSGSSSAGPAFGVTSEMTRSP